MSTEKVKEVMVESLAPIYPRNCVPLSMNLAPGGAILTIDAKGDKDCEEAARIDLEAFDHVAVFATGKASSSMCAEALKVMEGSRCPISAFVVTKPGHVSESERLVLESFNAEIRYGSHPVPDDTSLSSSLSLKEYCASRPSRTLFIHLLSGGTSSLLTLPTSPLTIRHLSEVNKVLLEAGEEIEDMNTVRRCMDDAKGGGVVRWCLGEAGGKDGKGNW